jgi:hypothetical protein
MSAKQIFLDLAVQVHSYWGCLSPREREAKNKGSKPGQFFASLPKELQEKLKELKSDDLQDVRLDGLFYFYDERGIDI